MAVGREEVDGIGGVSPSRIKSNSVVGMLANTAAAVFGPPQVNPNDGIDTTTEKMLPGSELHELVIWVIKRLSKGAVIAHLGYWSWVTPEIRLVGLLITVIWLGIEVVNSANTLFTARSWPLVNLFLVTLAIVLTSVAIA